MYNQKKRDKLSRWMSYVLRHNPSEFNLQLDDDGFVSLDTFVEIAIKQNEWRDATVDDIHLVVRECKKQRYEIIENKIRARYGHSEPKVSYTPATPPEFLYHGTNKGVIDKILKTGIKSMNRQYVHLSETTDFATLAGQRRGELVLVLIDAKKAFDSGIQFYPAGGEVWLSEDIPADFIKEVIK